MGWAGGSDLYDEVIAILKRLVPHNGDREEIHKELIPAFEGEDWDTQDECIGLDPAFDNALNFLHPDWRDDD